jgi:NAD(P)-dependent dehydrogenase (short-subunit alcohol dehydrogenase family)
VRWQVGKIDILVNIAGAFEIPMAVVTPEGWTAFWILIEKAPSCVPLTA